MLNNNVKHIVFSSSAAVYGMPQYLPLDENHPRNPINFYGYTKAAIEDLNTANANIGKLDAIAANIESIMAGNIGAGTLQTIHLTAENVVLDEAVVKELIAAEIDVSDLKAGTISTDQFTIQSDDGGIKIVGSTQQF